MIGLPSDSQAGGFILRHAPRHGITKCAHAVLLYIIAAEVHQGKVHETAYGHVRSLVDLTLPAVDAQLSCHWSVQPAEWNPCMGACYCAAEVRAAKGFGQSNQNWHHFGLASCHDTIHGHMPRRCVAMGDG